MKSFPCFVVREANRMVVNQSRNGNRRLNEEGRRGEERRCAVGEGEPMIASGGGGGEGVCGGG